MFYESYSSKDRKILMWDKRVLEDFVCCFTLDEYYEMEEYFNSLSITPDNVDFVSSGEFSCLVYEYTRLKLLEFIEYGDIVGIKGFSEAYIEWCRDD